MLLLVHLSIEFAIGINWWRDTRNVLITLTTNRLLNQLEELKRPFHSYGMCFDFIVHCCHVPVFKKGWNRMIIINRTPVFFYQNLHTFKSPSLLPFSLFILAHFIRISIKLLKASSNYIYFFCCYFIDLNCLLIPPPFT